MGKPVDNRDVETIQFAGLNLLPDVVYTTTEEYDILDGKGNPTGEKGERYKIQYRHIAEITWCLLNANGQIIPMRNDKGEDTAEPEKRMIPHETAYTDAPEGEAIDKHAIIDFVDGQWYKEDTLRLTGNVV